MEIVENAQSNSSSPVLSQLSFDDVHTLMLILYDSFESFVCQKWLKRIVEEKDVRFVLEDKRGSYDSTTFYDHFPELKMEAMAYVLEDASEKQATFNISGFASFLNEKFRELYMEQFDKDAWNTDKLIRSLESCRLDLIEWVGIHAKNVARPYFEGDEREDVVESRKKFIDHFLNNKEAYFLPSKEGNIYKWTVPVSGDESKIIILLCHDESTFKSGEVPAYRWIFPHIAPFFSKGRGRSIMLSMFMVQHNESDIFTLNEAEWNEAVKAFPILKEAVPILNYFE
jgi:hypothetical protein